MLIRDLCTRCSKFRVHSETIAGDCDKVHFAKYWVSFIRQVQNCLFHPVMVMILNLRSNFFCKALFWYLCLCHYFFLFEWKTSTTKGITKESGLPYSSLTWRIEFLNFSVDFGFVFGQFNVDHNNNRNTKDLVTNRLDWLQYIQYNLEEHL